MIRKKITMEVATEIAAQFDIPQTREHLLRVCRGWQIFAEGGVELEHCCSYLSRYRVISQGRNWKKRRGIDTYPVWSNGDHYPTCDCPDWRRPGGKPVPAEIPVNLHRCKHGIAVMLFQGHAVTVNEPPPDGRPIEKDGFRCVSILRPSNGVVEIEIKNVVLQGASRDEVLANLPHNANTAHTEWISIAQQMAS